MTIPSDMAERGAPARWPSSSGGGCSRAKRVLSGFWTRIVAMWNAALNFFVPYGYEDETGFHYGEMRRPADQNKPSRTDSITPKT